MSIVWTYREDGTLKEREYYHNPIVGGSSQSTLISCYDEKGRIVHEKYFMTHGSHDTYTIYFLDRTDAYYVDIDPWCGNDLKIYHITNTNVVFDEDNDNLTFDEKIKIVKDNYYEIQTNLDHYKKSGNVEGLVCYHDQDQIKKIIASASVYPETKDLFAGYTAEYYYLDENVNFVFVYSNSEEYRFYMDINRCMK